MSSGAATTTTREPVTHTVEVGKVFGLLAMYDDTILMALRLTTHLYQILVSLMQDPHRNIALMLDVYL